jgi:hypothetical protein
MATIVRVRETRSQAGKKAYVQLSSWSKALRRRAIYGLRLRKSVPPTMYLCVDLVGEPKEKRERRAARAAATRETG